MPKSTETEIAVLQTQMTEVKASLETMKLDQHTNFIALSNKIDGLSGTPLEMKEMDKRLVNLEKSKARNWIWNTLSAMAGAALAGLIIYAIVHTH